MKIHFRQEAIMIARISFGMAMLLCALPALAQEQSLDEQYKEASLARTRAELSIRKTRQFFEEGEAKWRAGNHALETSRSQIQQALAQAIQQEQRRPEDMRNLALIEELQQRQQQIERDWARFIQVERPNVETLYRAASSMIHTVSQAFSQLTQLENVWKDARVDMTTLKAAYDAVADRADAVRKQAEDAMNQQGEYLKMWQSRAAAATQPTGW
jgi:hypothetical protein